MKRLILIFALWLMLPGATAYCFPPVMPTSGGAVGTDAIWDAKGDLAVGSAANTAVKLTIGTAYQILHVNTDTPGWTSTLGAAGTPLTAGYFTDLTTTNAPVVGGVTLTPAADVTGAGDCTGGACLDGSSDGGTYVRLYDGNSHYTQLSPGDSSANLTFTFPTAHAAQNNTPILSSSAGVLSPATFSLPAADCNEGEIMKADGSGNMVCSATLGLTTFILPSTDADPATTAGTIKHDTSDTDASAGGIVEWWDGTNTRRLIDGAASAAANYTVVVKTEYIPIAYAENGAAAPADATVWADTRKARIRVFAADADDDVEIHWMVPLDYVGGIKFRAIGFVDNATAPGNTETVIFNLAGCSVGNSDDGGCTLGTGVDSTFTADATYAQNDRWASAWSNEITVTNIAVGESAMLKLFRDVDDTYAQGIGVAGIEIKYKARINLVDTY